jgi:8-amino-7-oxononanoate synthase
MTMQAISHPLPKRLIARPMSALDGLIRAALDAIRGRSQYRALRPFAMRGGGRLEQGDRELLDFSSNDYLGLAQHPLLKERAIEWTQRHGTGAGASRLVTGTSDLHLAVEAKIAAFKGSEAALIFGSGWQANAAVLPTLLQAAPGALLFTDRLIHASLHHGAAAAGVRQIRFRHNDLAHLEELLEARRDQEGARFIVTESIFSMDGDAPDLAALAQLAKRHDAFLIVDEAHATGVAGPRGAGLSATVPGGVDLVIGTFSKALGGFGAYVSGSKLVCDYLVNACGGFIFATAPPPAVLGAMDAALDLVPGMDAERAHLAALADHVRSRLHAAGYDTAASTSQIVPLVVGEAEKALALSRRLEEHGILAAAIRPPTVPPGSSRLRLALRATHDMADIAQLLGCLTDRAPKAA